MLWEIYLSRLRPQTGQFQEGHAPHIPYIQASQKSVQSVFLLETLLTDQMKVFDCYYYRTD